MQCQTRILNKQTVFFSLGMLACLIIFSVWFTNQQIAFVSPEPSHYPFSYYFITLYKVSLYTLALFCACQYGLDLLCDRKLSMQRMFITLLPLVLVQFSLSLSSVIILMLLLSLGFMLPCYKKIAGLLWRRKIDLAVLTLLIVWCTFYKNMDIFSPYNWSRALFNFRSEEIATTAQIYKNYILSKQFSFSDMDYAQWAGVIHSPNGLVSPLLQTLALVFNLPSIDIKSFFKVILIMLYFLAIAGSFGFYLYFRYALQTRIGIAVAASLLFTLGNAFFLNSLAIEYFIFVVNYFLFPYVLLGLHFTLKQKSAAIACWTGAILALPFFILSPHPEATIYSLFAYAIFSVMNILFIDKQACSRVHALKLITLSLVSCFVLSLFHLGPLLWEVLNNNMYVYGHIQTLTAFSDSLPDIHHNILKHYYYLILYCFPLIFLQQLIERKVMIDSWAWFLFAFIIIFLDSLNRIIDYLPFLHFLSTIKLHLNLSACMRPAFIFAFCGITIFCIAANSLITLIIQAIKWIENLVGMFYSNKKFFTVMTTLTILIVDSAIVIYTFAALNHHRLPFIPQPIQPINSQSTANNPNNCDYYIGLNAHLVNYAGLAKDPANLAYIKSQLTLFERDLNAAPTMLVKPYRDAYFNTLTTLGIYSVNEVNGTMILTVANAVKTISDNFYLDNTVNCVNPLLFDRKAPRRILQFNLDALYANIPHRFMRIVGVTGDENHLGLGSGLFVHNATETYEIRYIVGYPLLHIFYALSWTVLPEQMLNTTARKLFNIAGIDIATFKEPLDHTTSTGWQPITYQLSPGLDPHYFVYQNVESYGMTYLANHIIPLDANQIKQDETIIRDFIFNNPKRVSQNKFDKARLGLQAQLFGLKNKHDVLIEKEGDQLIIPTSSKTPAGSIQIHNIVGEKAAMTAQCNRLSCLFVFNTANLPGWHAFVNRQAVPIYRVNFAFMGIPIPQGESHIWFIYQPWSSLVFYSISLGWLMLILLGGWKRSMQNDDKST